MVLHEAEESAAKVIGRSQQQDRKHRLKHRFEVSKKLGQGTYGKVQLAINKETGQEVAIKTIKKSKIESEQDLVRIRREIQIMSSIQHPHIIHIYEVFENKEKIVLVMQYASGGELYDYLSEKKALHDGDARRIFRQIAAAVYYCHKNKICHRDLKLENVLLDERGNAKIADFGLSNVFDERHLLGTFCGSPLYASPEIVKGTPYYGPEVDCWSMGVLLYTLVYGAMPFDGSNFKRLVKQISDGDYYEPKKKSEASGLIRRLLTVSPAKRATIIDICTDWWVNLGYEHSLLQVSEDMANLTPVRIDLLLALAPSSPTPPNEVDAFKQLQAKMKESQKKDGGADLTSSSFAFISGGMAGDVQQIKAENPDDIFHENDEGSEEEFLSADAAAELEGLGDYEDRSGEKRRADKSFDGSMLRVSSIAHKTKKPRKSDSHQKHQKSQSTLESPMEVKPTEIAQEMPAQEALVGDGTKEIPETNDTEILSSATVPDKVQVSPEDASRTVEPEVSMTSGRPVENQVPRPEPETASPSVPVQDEVSKEETKVPAPVPEPSSPPKEKKVKRKIISSKKQAAEKTGKEKGEPTVDPDQKTDSKTSPEKSPVKSKSPVKTVREKSPSKGRESSRRSSLEPKEQTRRPSVDKETVRKPQTESKVSSRRSSIENKESGSRRPSLETRESPRKSSTEPRESPRRGSVDPSKSPKKVEPPKPAEKPKPLEKPATAGSRKPGKLVIPKFLESPQSTPSPKQAEVKKLVLPRGSVSDAKRAFECKSKTNLKTPETKKIAAVTADDTKPAESTTPTESKDKVEQVVESTPETEVLPEVPTPSSEEITPSESSPATSALQTEVPQEEPKPNLEDKSTNEDPSLSPSQTSNEPSTPEEDEKKKAGAKSILIKSIAKARLTERKLSQQSSVDSETGSVSSPVIGSPVVSKATSVPFLKTPKPYVKEDVDATVKSHAEIVLTDKTEDSKPHLPADVSAKSEEESIWGMPLAPSGDKQLKRSVLSSSIESDMNNWRQEVEESLKRLSPEGASEEPAGYSTLIGVDPEEAGPSPISRSYKKFTFNKDGTCTTETGKIYTKPENNGTWTKVEKSTKVTTQPGSKVLPEPIRGYREMSPLRHSDSQSSSGSNDVFDDIFDTWTGDSVFGNLMNVNSMFGRLPKDPFRRRERRRDSMRRHKADKKGSQDWTKSEKRPGNLTDRDSSDNEDDFDFHFDGSDPIVPGSPNMLHFMKSMNKDFKNHLRAFKERHMPSYSRSLSRDRGDPVRGRDSTSRNAQTPMTRSVSRDRAQSPPETVLRFVIESPRRQTSVRSEPRTYGLDDLRSSRQRLFSDGFESDILGKGTRDIGPLSDFSNRFSHVLSSPDTVFDRTSLYGTIRPKAHQRYHKSMSKDAPSSPSTPQSNRSGPELTTKPQYDFSPENRRQKVETWLQMNTDDPKEEFDPYFRARTHLQDVPENRVYHPITTRTYSKYNRSNTDLFDQGTYPHLTRDQRSESLTSLERKREPNVVHFGPAPDSRSSPERFVSQDSRRDPNEGRQGSGSPECPLADKPPRQPSQTRVSSPGGMAYSRSMSNTPFRVITSPESVIEMETPGSGSPMVRMRVSFTPNPGGSAATRESPVTSPGIPEGIWNQETNARWRSNDGDDSLSLLEALKTRGYRNVISQRFQHDQPAREMRPEGAVPSPTEAGDQQVRCQQQEAPQRGKACSYASAESENDACCMDTNPADSAKEETANGDTSPPESNKTKKNGEEASDGTLTPDSLDSSKEKPGEFKPKNYEEESVSERIRRKSYFLRFNDDRPRRKSFYRDSDFLPDYRSGLWSRFSIEGDTMDNVPIVPRRTNRKKSSTEKRSSANLDDYLDEYGTRRSDSRSSYNHDDFLSDDGLWGAHSTPRYTNGHTANNEGIERPGSLWTQRGRHKTGSEQSVVDTVPDLGERRWTSRNSFSFYSPTVTPKSPVLSHQPLLSSDSNQRVLRRSSLNEGGDCTLSEESDSKSRASEDCPGTVDSDPNEIISRAMDLLSQFSQD